MEYEVLSSVYDRLMGDRSAEAERMRRLIRRYCPAARTLLEIACGSGALLKPLSDHFEVAGLDLSPHMLTIAQRRLPRAELQRCSMVKFKFGRRFDAVLCLFDSINHLRRWSEWQRTFRCVASHLKKDGVFIFDINTIARLDRLTGTSSFATCGRDYVGFRVSGNGRGRVIWNIDLFERAGENRFRLRQERIPEIALPVPQIRRALEKVFRRVDLLNEGGRATKTDYGRRYFACVA